MFREKLTVRLAILLLLTFASSCRPTETSLPSPLVSPTFPLWLVPTPASPDVGIVTGRLVIGKNSWTNPFPIYLGEIILSNGTPAIVSLDKSRAPRSQLDSSGRFVFSNVPPGKYCLILDLVTKTIVLRNPSTGNDLIIVVEGGKIIDIGELHYFNLPLSD